MLYPYARWGEMILHRPSISFGASETTKASKGETLLDYRLRLGAWLFQGCKYNERMGQGR